MAKQNINNLYKICIQNKKRLQYLLGMIFLSYDIYLALPNRATNKDNEKKYKIASTIILYPLWLYFAFFMFARPAYILVVIFIGLRAYDLYYL